MKPFVTMTPAEYAAERRKRGTQAEVAGMLGIHRVSLARREIGAPDCPITTEAALAILALPLAEIDSSARFRLTLPGKPACVIDGKEAKRFRDAGDPGELVEIRKRAPRKKK
jgi:hypothetical protein